MPEWVTFININGMIVYQADWYGLGAVEDKIKHESSAAQSEE